MTNLTNNNLMVYSPHVTPSFGHNRYSS